MRSLFSWKAASTTEAGSYMPIQFSDASQSDETAGDLKSRSGRTKWYILGLAGFEVLSILALGLYTISRSTKLHYDSLTDDGKVFPSGFLSWSQRFTPLPCGKSPTEALARGCHFDIIATAWLPQKCIDSALITEFNEYFQWQYFRDGNGSDPYDMEPDTLGSQNSRIYTTNRWHVAHCLFMWKKLNRSLMSGWMTDAETVTQGHTDHCSRTIMELEKPKDEIGGYIEIIYPPC